MHYKFLYLIKKILPETFHPFFKRLRSKIQNLNKKLSWQTQSKIEFIELLADLGFKQGAVVLLHCSMDSIIHRVPSMTPFKFIDLLIGLLGKEGTLMMPTFPFQGYQLDYINIQRNYNPKLTPSKVGLVSELFRRRSDVVRSLHPTHSIAAWGKHKEEILIDHHLGTAFGKNSPFYKMCYYNGTVISVGVHPRTCFTILHVPEELHPKTREYQYEKKDYTMVIKGEDTINYKLNPLRTDRSRNYDRSIKIMIKEGILRSEKHKGLKVGSAKAKLFIKRALELIDANLCYS